MADQASRSAGEGLERLCERQGSGWICTSQPARGLELLQAWFIGAPYVKHRHDTYTIGITDSGVQEFNFRGAVHRSTPGNAVVLHPDELHDGRAGTDQGFGYRTLYIEPRLIADALYAIGGRPAALPFLREPITTNGRLIRAVETAFQFSQIPLLIDTLSIELAQGLQEATTDGFYILSDRFDTRAIERAREYLDAHARRIVHSSELEKVTGLSRYELARQFKLKFGTSPYRYLLMRRLDFTRKQIDLGRSLVDLALEAGFADQAHFTRMFKSAFGLTPGAYAKFKQGLRSQKPCYS